MEREPGEDPGTYQIYASISSTNYKPQNPITPGTFTINELTYVAVIDNKNKTYGDTDPEFTVTVTDVKGNPVDPASIGMVITREQGENAGTYAIKASFEDSSVAARTSVTEGTLTIAPKKISIVVQDATKMVGESDPVFTSVITDENGNPIEPAALGVTITREKGENPGTYKISLRFTNQNYEAISYTEGKLTILAKSDPVKPDPGKKDPGVQTGDSNSMKILLYTLLMIACAAEAFLLILRRKRANRK